MKRIMIFALFISAFSFAYSQENYSMEYGKVTQYEMSLNEYIKDKDAEAVVIYDLGDYFFQGHDRRGFLLYMKRKTKIKILKSAGIDYANFEIPYYVKGNDWEEIYDIEATTYNLENGQLTKTILDQKNIFEEKVSSNWNMKKIALSNVREGSVIEISYTIITPYFENLREWNFQKKIPVVYSKLNYRAIPYFEYVYIMKGTNKLDEFDSKEKSNEIRFGNLNYREMEYTFGMKDLPAFKDEEFITSENDYMVSINFQLSKIYYPHGGHKEYMSTWPALCDEYIKSEHFGKYIKNTEKEGKKILPTLKLENETPLKQTQIITEFVKTNFNWNGRYGKYAEIKLSDFLQQKKGNVANINLFLIGLLRNANIETYPVVLSTRQNGLIRKNYPFSEFLNYVVVQAIIDDKTYYIDATESLLYFSDLPPRCINVEGLVVKPKTEEWVALRQKGISFDQKEFTLTILPENNQIKTDARFIGQGYNAYNYRSIYLGKDDNLIKYIKDKNNINITGNINITDNINNLNKPFNFNFSYELPIEGTPEKIFIHPFNNQSISDNPFKQTDRKLPVDLINIKGYNYRSTIEIPQGYKVEYLTDAKTIDNNLIKMDYLVLRDENIIKINAGYIFKKNIYNASDYNDLKMAFADIIKKMSELIILVKE